MRLVASEPDERSDADATTGELLRSAIGILQRPAFPLATEHGDADERHLGRGLGEGETNGEASASRSCATLARAVGTIRGALCRNCEMRRARRSGSRATSAICAQPASIGGSTGTLGTSFGVRTRWL